MPFKNDKELNKNELYRKLTGIVSIIHHLAGFQMDFAAFIRYRKPGVSRTFFHKRRPVMQRRLCPERGRKAKHKHETLLVS